ncbi:uncharacterized protein LOC131220297 [Magnolia sinica]|uniref:uncharacterized protein LOC131220297 n=1 Tax=Magnolia sinica TaxID=86752 RepID=UPI0026588275|nr:uncharacterized protein LOC131220297 [Magnolia sinica]
MTVAKYENRFTELSRYAPRIVADETTRMRRFVEGLRAGSDLVRTTTEKIEIIRRRLLTAQSRQKRYADTRRRDLEFEVGDHVLLRISPMKGVLHFGKKGKLAPRYIGPFQFLDHIGPVAYRLALPTLLTEVHNVFHVFMLKKYIPDPTHVIWWQHVELKDNATYILRPTQILNKKEQVLRNEVIPLVKVLWTHYGEEEATWETEAEIRKHYPNLLKQYE